MLIPPVNVTLFALLFVTLRSTTLLPADGQKTQSANMNRDQLWNMAEAAEKRKDGNPARKVLIVLPKERLALTQEYAQWMADRLPRRRRLRRQFSDKLNGSSGRQ